MILLVIRENSFILMSSSMHLNCFVAQSSLTSLCKTVKGTPMYGRRQRSRTPLSRSLNGFVTNPSSHDIFYQVR